MRPPVGVRAGRPFRRRRPFAPRPPPLSGSGVVSDPLRFDKRPSPTEELDRPAPVAGEVCLPMATRWTFEGWVYTAKNGTVEGPVSTERLKQVIGTGEVQPADRVWRKWSDGDTLLLPALAREVFNPVQPAEPF